MTPVTLLPAEFSSRTMERELADWLYPAALLLPAADLPRFLPIAISKLRFQTSFKLLDTGLSRESYHTSTS
jgi:hypothetical protein